MCSSDLWALLSFDTAGRTVTMVDGASQFFTGAIPVVGDKALVLPANGFASAAANNVLYINVSGAAGPNVYFTLAGTEE